MISSRGAKNTWVVAICETRGESLLHAPSDEALGVCHTTARPAGVRREATSQRRVACQARLSVEMRKIFRVTMGWGLSNTPKFVTAKNSSLPV